MPPGKDKDASPSAEINRLKAIVVKDPRSKMFIPLAEEYIKAGMPDEAVAVLTLGLKANPFYTSARVMLGKAYIEQGLAEKACDEFERVVSVAPDNIFAHRKLGEIYLGRGMKEEAMKSFKMVAVLNPKDDEARRFIEDMEKGEASATEAPAEGAIAEDASHIEPEMAVQIDIASPPEEEAPAVFDVAEAEAPAHLMEPVEAEEDFSVPVWSVDDVEVEEPARQEQPEWGEEQEQLVQLLEPEQTDWSEQPEQHELQEEPEQPERALEPVQLEEQPEQAEQPEQLEKPERPEEPEQPEQPEQIEEPQPTVMEMPVPEMETLVSLESLEQAAPLEDLYGEHAEGEEEGPDHAGAYSLDVNEGMGLDEILSSYGDAAVEYEAVPEETGGVYEIDEEISPAGIEDLEFETGLIPLEEDTVPAEEPLAVVYEPEEEAAPPTAPDIFETRTLAELYVAQGFYDRAIGIYKSLLLDDPGNLELRAKLDELYGRPGRVTSGASPLPETAFSGGNEEAIVRLEHFLEAIRRKAGR